MSRVDWVLDRSKYLSRREAKRLIKIARETGLRVMEIAQLNCGDIHIDEKTGSLIVRRGKGGKKRLVRFNSEFKHHYDEYLKWKQAGDEPIGQGDPLLRSSHTGGHMTPRALEKAFKRVAAKAGLPEHYSIHCLRHTYACQLYKASGYNLRLVQKQLGHSNSRTTEVYADVMNPDLAKSLEKLYV